ncbi:MAG: hypothetical protein ACPL4K_05360, partial [Candidatus Margulisiibacteriota bacterium]
ENKHTTLEIWESTILTFLTKFVFALTFALPFFLLPFAAAIVASIIWGLALLCAFSFYMAKTQNENPLVVVGEHLIIGVLVILISHYLGDLISATFK